MNGSERLRLVVIGKTKHQGCIRGIQRLPITYLNGKAWMTQAIFEAWLQEEDVRFARQG